MTAFDFDDRGRAYVDLGVFIDYVMKNAYDDDYTCDTETYWQYYNCGGCKLAEYNKIEGYGVVF